MKNVLLALLLMSSATTFAGTNADKCDEDTKSKVHFKLSRDRKNDVVTHTGKKVNISVEVNNTSAAAVRATIDFYSEGKLIQSLTTPANVVAGTKTTVTDKVIVNNGKKIDNIKVSLKNIDCTDTKKNVVTLQANDNAEIKTALNEIGF